MINGICEKILSGITDLGAESIKHSFNDKLDETKLRKILYEFIEKQKNIFDDFDYLDGIDYQGL